MAATIGKVSAVFTASTSGLKAGVQDAGAAFRKLSGDVAGLRSGMRLLNAIQGAQLFGQVAGAAMSAGRSFLSMAQGQAETIDSTSKLSRRLGLTYGELAGLSLAGDLAGVSMETIGKAATKADIAFVKASQGSTQAQAALAGVGLSVAQLEGMSPAERFQAMADAIAGIPTPAERSRAAVALFGKQGAELLPLFEGGAGSIKQAMEEAERFGLVLTDNQGKNVEEMNDAFTRAYASIQGVVQQVVAYLAPAIQGVTDTFTSLVGGIGGANIGQFIGEGIMAGAEFIATVADSMIAGLSGVWEYVSTVGTQWASVFDMGNRVAGFLSMAANTFKFVMAAGILGLTATITGLAKIGQYLGGLVGAKSPFLDGFIAGADGFNASLMTSMDEASVAAGEGFSRAFGDSQAAAAGVAAGPITSTVRDALARAREAAAATNTATQTGVQTPPVAPAFSGPSAEALRATDSRSKEGIAEMFRLMRGGATAAEIAQQQLEEQRRTNELLSDRGEDVEALEMAG